MDMEVVVEAAMAVIDVETTTETEEVLDLIEIIMVETAHVHTELDLSVYVLNFMVGWVLVFFLFVDLFPVS